MDDTISRQAVIEINRSHHGQMPNEVNHLIWKEIKALPSVQPDRKKGKWIKPIGMMPPEYAGVYRCSECDEIAMRDWKNHKQKLSNFCPMCGSDMRGEQG